MDTILNLIAVAGIWSSIALLAWGAILTLKHVFAPPTRAPEAAICVQSGTCSSAIVIKLPPASSRGEPVHPYG